MGFEGGPPPPPPPQLCPLGWQVTVRAELITPGACLHSSAGDSTDPPPVIQSVTSHFCPSPGMMGILPPLYFRFSVRVSLCLCARVCARVFVCLCRGVRVCLCLFVCLCARARVCAGMRLCVFIRAGVCTPRACALQACFKRRLHNDIFFHASCSRSTLVLILLIRL